MLTLLRKAAGAYVSGEQAARQLGLSRTAVWKAVDALRSDGYAIEARTGLGYRLTAAPNVLTEAEIRTFLGPTGTVGREILCLDEVDSTNTWAKRLALSGASDGTVAAANYQSAGRGRLNRAFQSPRNQGVYLTALLRPELPPQRLLPATALCAVAVRRAIQKTTGLQPQIKWANDLVIGGKKLCGILTEMSLEGESGSVQYLVMGIGVNVLQGPEDFSPEVRTMATSLRMELGASVSRPELAAAEIQELDGLYTALRTGETAQYLEEYRRSCVTLGREVQLLRADGTREHVRALDIDEDFGLVVRGDGGREFTVRSGEASVRGMYGYAE
jgi:BirA family biotin operon repressor/biotin-[acetyl-CoA-carboxylase] ligase